MLSTRADKTLHSSSETVTETTETAGEVEMKLAVIRDKADLDLIKDQKFDSIFSVRDTPGTIGIGLDSSVGKDLSLLAFAGAMTTVGRWKLDELWIPHFDNPKFEAVVEKVVDYFAGKSLDPHHVTIKWYGEWHRLEIQAYVPINPIVLMGGGTDSCGIYAYYAKKGLKPIGLYYEYGQGAKSSERKAIFDIAKHFNSQAIRSPLNLSKIRRELNKFDSISMEGAFPARNWIFYALTLDRLVELQGNEIAVSVFKGEFDDHHPDHSPITLNDFQQLIDLYVGPNKCRVVVPMRTLDKSDAVYWYKEKIEQEWPIDKTRSCYGMFNRIDGACTGCMNKFVSQAFAGYDMHETQFYKSDWATSNGNKVGSRVNPTAATKYFHKYFKRALEGKNYHDGRNSEIMWVMGKYRPSHKNVQTEYFELLKSNEPRVRLLLDMATDRWRDRNAAGADAIEKVMNDARTKPLLEIGK